jgi:hypothetical protein
MAFRTKKISQMDPKGSNLASTDLLEISQLVSGSYVTKSITGAEIIASVPASVTAWGTITGTLSAQTDLNTALSGKVPTSRTLTINGTTQDLSADRTFTISTGITIGTTAITSGTVGRVLFQGSGNVVQQSSSLFWDNTNGRLGIGTSTPTVALHVSTSASTTAVFQQSGRPNITFLNNTTSIGVVGGAVAVSGGVQNDFGIGTNGTTNNLIFATGTGYSERIRIAGTTGNVLINTTTDAGFKLDVNGTARVSGNMTVSLNQNTTTSLSILNTTAGTLSNVSLQLISDTAAGTAQVFKYSSTRNAYKTILANDFGHYNATAGDISFLNDFATGKIKFAAGASSTVQMTIGANGNVLINTTTDVASSKLTIESTTQGFLPPRGTNTQMLAIASPATALIFFDTTNNKLNCYDGTTWQPCW